MTLTPPSNRIEKKAGTVWRIQGLIYVIFYVVLVVGYVLLRHFLWEGLPFFIIIVSSVFFGLIGLLQMLVIPSIRLIYWGYDINEQDIDIQHGIIIIKRTLIPMNRIQHVDTEHGPIMRLFGLSTLNIATAGTAHKIPALKMDTARALRKRISNLASLSDDDV